MSRSSGNRGFHPRIAWNGDILRDCISAELYNLTWREELITFLLTVWTVPSEVNSYIQFIISVEQSVWGCLLVDIFDSTQHKVINCPQNFDENFGSLLETIKSGNTCSLKTCSKKHVATSSVVPTSQEDTECTRLDTLSRKMVSQLYLLSVLRKWVINSIDMDPHLLCGGSNGCKTANGLPLLSLLVWLVVQSRKYASMFQVLFFQWKFSKRDVS